MNLSTLASAHKSVVKAECLARRRVHETAVSPLQKERTVVVHPRRVAYAAALNGYRLVKRSVLCRHSLTPRVQWSTVSEPYAVVLVVLCCFLCLLYREVATVKFLVQFCILSFFLCKFLLHQVGIFVKLLASLCQFCVTFKHLALSVAKCLQFLLCTLYLVLVSLYVLPEIIASHNVFHYVRQSVLERCTLHRHVVKSKVAA